MAFMEIVRILFALIAVLGLIGLVALGAKKFGLDAAGLRLKRERRLALVEVLALDGKRRAAILRCDGRDHLIVLNANSVTVIERGIDPPAEEDTDRPGGEIASFAAALEDAQSPEKKADAAPVLSATG